MIQLTPDLIERLRNQIRKEGIIEFTAIGAYMAFWTGQPVFGNSEELAALECEDIVYVTNGHDSAYAYTDSEFYRKNIAPRETAKAYNDAIQNAERPPKKSLIRRLLGL
jgi:hypothetical protein